MAQVLETAGGRRRRKGTWLAVVDINTEAARCRKYRRVKTSTHYPHWNRQNNHKIPTAKAAFGKEGEEGRRGTG